MSFPPDVYLIGAMKAGTTSLADLLAKHPDVAVSSPKEPHFFTENLGKDLDWYKACFKDVGRRVCVDASTSYSIAPVPGPFKYKRECERYLGVPSRIKAINPDAKIIYMLRNPVARTYSHYLHNARTGWEKRPLRQAIEEDSQYLSASNYPAQIALYREHFDDRSIKVLLFEDFIKSPESVARECFAFMGVGHIDGITLEHAKNEGFLYNGIGIKLHKLGLMSFASSLLPKPVKNFIAPLVTKPTPKMSEDERSMLDGILRPQFDQLEREHGLNLSAWKKKPS